MSEDRSSRGQSPHKLLHLSSATGEVYVFWCPGCQETHVFTTRYQGRPSWQFDGNLEEPTFSPSLLYPDKKPRCHLFLRKGILEYLGDCDHPLAGQQVPLSELPPEYA